MKHLKPTTGIFNLEVSMKIRIVVLASVVAMASSWYALAAGDYERLKKDVGVMSQIIDSVFKADKECGHCKVKVAGKYLADQGIVFLVNSRTHRFSWTNGGDSSNSYSFSIEDFEEFERLPEVVTRLAGLERLDLDGNKLTTLPENLGHLVGLKWLKLERNKLTEEEKTRIREALPDCHVSF